MPNKLRAIFFDAGNTLLYPRLDERARDLTEAGFPAEVKDFHAAERDAKQKLDIWLWPQIRQGEVPRAIDHYYWGEYLRALMERIRAPENVRGELMLRVANGFRNIRLWSRVFPETPPYLEKLRGEGYYLGVISNSIGTMEEQLNHVGLARHFDAVFDSAVVGVEKPHPEIFRLALHRAGVSPAESLFVGDTNATDMGGAQLAGLHGVLIDRVKAYDHVDFPRIFSLPELDSILDQIKKHQQ